MPHPSHGERSAGAPAHKEHGGRRSGGVHDLMRLPGHGERFEEEWATTKRRIEMVAAAAVPRETEPAGAPRLDRSGSTPPSAPASPGR
jgi:hypothetical protein